MKRKLIQQMRNEWRSNLWMMTELVIVGVVLWFVFAVFAGIISLHQKPKGIDYTDVYFGQIGTIGKDADTFKAYKDSTHNYWTDLEALINNLKTNPYVESIGTGNNAIPYNFNYSGWVIHCAVGDTIQDYSGNMREMTPDMIRTLRLTGLNGETSDELAAMVEEGKFLISTYDKSWYKNDPKQWVGREATIGQDSTLIQIGVLINGIRRSDYEPVFGGVIVSDRGWYPSELALRVKPGKGREFMESLKADDLEFGNVYLYNVQSVDNRKESAHLEVHNVVRNLTACAAFVMIAVFLGFLGSFWYRTQQRVPELAMRRVNGATDSDLFRRFISEGLLMLAMSSPFIIGIITLLITSIDMEEIMSVISSKVMWLAVPVTLAVLALMIVAGVWLPARKAMKINPAEALKDQ